MTPANELLAVLLARGEYLVTLAQVYVDESGSHRGSPVLCLGGYVFLSDQAALFNEEWADILATYRLSHFHMADWEDGDGPFQHLRRELRVAALNNAIRVIKARAAFGFATTVNETEYLDEFKPVTEGAFGHWSAYYFCLNNCLSLARQWADSAGFDGKFAYFFESGHDDQKIANERMAEIFSIQSTSDRFRYNSHTFGDKKTHLHLQAADILAWQWFTHTKRKKAGATSDRQELIELVRPQDSVIAFDRQRLIGARENFLSVLAARSS